MKIVLQILAACWQRNRAWLAAFVAIWLIALCLPPVRQTLFFDLFGSSLIYGGGPLSFELNEPKEEFNFKKRLSQDLSTRFAALVEIGYAEEMQGVSLPSQVPLPTIYIKANKIVIAPARGTPKPPKGNPHAGIDKLIAQYPREAWLIAHRLRQTLWWMRDNRFAGLYEWQPPRPMKIPTVIPEKKPTPPYFTTQQWNQTFNLAKQGQQLEPDNAFFDVVLIYLHLAAYQDREALEVLTSAIRKSHFNDHVLHERLIVIRAHENFRPLLLEEKFQIRITANDGTNFIRTAMLLAWQAWKLENVGQRKQGLQLRHKVALLANLTQRNNIGQMGSYLGKSLQTHAYNLHPWQHLITSNHIQLQKQFKPGSLESELVLENSNAVRFMLAAKALGDNDIARATLQLAQQSAQYYKIAQNDTSSQGLSERDHAIMGGWHELRLIFAGQMFLMLGASFVFGFFLIASHHTPTPRNALAASIGWGLTAVILCAIAFIQLTQRRQATFSQSLHTAINLSLVACLLAPIVITALHTWIGAMRQLRQLRRTAAGATIEKRDILSIGVSWSFVVTTIIAVISCLLAIYFFIVGRGVATVPFITWNSAPVTFWGDFDLFSGIGVFLFCAIYVAWLFAWRVFTPKTLQPLLHGALRQHRNALSAFVLCSASLYVLTILISLPHRNAMNEKFENYLQGKSTQQTTQTTQTTE